MKLLVVSYSFSGNNELLAGNIARRLSCEHETIVEKRKRSFLKILIEMITRKMPALEAPKRTLDDYDHVVLAAPLWGRRAATPLRSFLANWRGKIKDFSFITISGGALGPNTGAREDLAALAGREPRAYLELVINELLPAGRAGKAKYTSKYKFSEKDFPFFQTRIDDFIGKVGP